MADGSSSAGKLMSILPVINAAAAVLALGIVLAAVLVAAGFVGSGGSRNTAVADVGSCPMGLTTEELFRELRKTSDEPPKMLIPVYQAAAAKFKLGSRGPSILAGVHSIETNFSRLDAQGVTSGQNDWGAAGPMQFGNGTGAAGDAWSTYGVDGDGNGKKDIYNTIDAIFAAAKYLGTKAPEDWRSALYQYNHADWYVTDVMGRADKYDIPEGSGSC